MTRLLMRPTWAAPFATRSSPVVVRCAAHRSGSAARVAAAAQHPRPKTLAPSSRLLLYKHRHFRGPAPRRRQSRARRRDSGDRAEHAVATPSAPSHTLPCDSERTERRCRAPPSPRCSRSGGPAFLPASPVRSRFSLLTLLPALLFVAAGGGATRPQRRCVCARRRRQWRREPRARAVPLTARRRPRRCSGWGTPRRGAGPPRTALPTSTRPSSVRACSPGRTRGGLASHLIHWWTPWLDAKIQTD